MQTYYVQWSVAVQASSFEDAVRQGHGMQQDPHNEATIFQVANAQGRRLVLDAQHLPAEGQEQPIVCPGCGRDNADSTRLDFRCGACAPQP